MMKCRIFLLFFMVVFMFHPAVRPSYAHEEPAKTLKEKADKDREARRIASARILAITQWKHEIKDGAETGRKQRSMRMEYSPSGRLALISVFSNDSVSQSAVYTYSGRGDMLTDVDLGSDRNVVEANEFAYDWDGRVISGTSRDAMGKKTGSFVHRFDRKNRVISFVKFFSGDSIEYTIDYLYGKDFDRSDYRAAEKKDRYGKLLLRVEKTLDDRGLTIEKKVFSDGVSLAYSFRYEYNAEGILTGVSRLLADGTVEWSNKYTLNGDGTYAELRSYGKAGGLSSRTTFEYDYFGEKIR